ncbi:hypothetical protein KM043_006691 [Ampulex compressa]|nr:hypothetical protein KM043_006691 [Ampulex compressa]
MKKDHPEEVCCGTRMGTASSVSARNWFARRSGTNLTHVSRVTDVLSDLALIGTSSPCKHDVKATKYSSVRADSLLLLSQTHETAVSASV